MSWLPKSPKARRRLTLFAVIAPVLALAVGLTLWGLKDSISFFYTPSQAAKANPPAGRANREPASLVNVFVGVVRCAALPSSLFTNKLVRVRRLGAQNQCMSLPPRNRAPHRTANLGSGLCHACRNSLSSLSSAPSIRCGFFNTPANKSPFSRNRSRALRMWNWLGW